MRDLENWRQQLATFAKTHMRELAAELLEWQDTGILKDGRLRELGQMASAAAGQDGLKVAENFVVREALQLAAQVR